MTRGQTELAAPDEPRIEFTLNGIAAACLSIDEQAIWPNLETLKQRRVGRGGWQYTIRIPVDDAKRMLDDLIGRGNQGSGEGYDQGPSEKYACRRAAEHLSDVLKLNKPTWWRPF